MSSGVARQASAYRRQRHLQITRSSWNGTGAIQTARSRRAAAGARSSAEYRHTWAGTTPPGRCTVRPTAVKRRHRCLTHARGKASPVLVAPPLTSALDQWVQTNAGENNAASGFPRQRCGLEHANVCTHLFLGI
jgi:hypothetical protein